MPNLSIHKPSRLWSRNTTQLEDTPSKSRQDRVGLIGLFTNEHKSSRKRSSGDDEDDNSEEPKRKKQRKEKSVTRFLKKCIPKKKPSSPVKQEPPPCENIDVTNPFKLPVIEWTGGCIYLCIADIDFDHHREEYYEDIMHFPKPPNWRASVPPANQTKRRQRKESCPSRFSNIIEESSDDESDMPRTPTTSNHETLLLSKIENLSILS